ncbi:MAG: sporulation integral membrane protein YtvI [Clostridia bacterium]|nr:sporulation integral membrane protein YtvI [Clostridia bacterium]
MNRPDKTTPSAAAHPRPAPTVADTAKEDQERARADRIWIGRAARLFCLFSALLGGYLLLTRGLPLLLPFALALLLSLPVRRGARALHRRLGIPQRLGAVVLIIATLLVLISLTVLLGERLVLEAQHLLGAMQSDSHMLSARLESALDFFTRITSHIPLLQELVEQQSLESFWQQVDATVAALISDTLTRWSGKIPDAIAALLRALPSTLVFVLTFLIAVFYCCTDDGRITEQLRDLVPPLWRDRLQLLRDSLIDVGVRYLRAYLLLFLLTFVQLYIGFTVLGLEYTFLPALLIALVDILPVLGAGTVLVPWGIIVLWQGNTFAGVGLLVLFGVMLLLRQILEPRILGGSLGLHPLATLLAVYAGLRLGGIPGMIVAPAVAMLIKSALGSRRAAQERHENVSA